MNDRIKPAPEVGTAGADWSEAGKYRTLSDSIDQGFCVVEVIFDANGRAEDYRFIEVNASSERQIDFCAPWASVCSTWRLPTNVSGSTSTRTSR